MAGSEEDKEYPFEEYANFKFGEDQAFPALPFENSPDMNNRVDGPRIYAVRYLVLLEKMGADILYPIACWWANNIIQQRKSLY